MAWHHRKILFLKKGRKNKEERERGKERKDK